jgi:hypothetical protein
MAMKPAGTSMRQNDHIVNAQTATTTRTGIKTIEKRFIGRLLSSQLEPRAV